MLLLVAVIVVCFVRTEFPSPEPTPAPTPVPATASPEISSQPTPEPTPESTPEPTPEITPEPTPQPTPEPTPQPGRELGSGSFSSDTGTSLNLVVQWSARSSSGTSADITIDIYAQSYSFYTSALPGSITLTVNGTGYSLGSPDIQYGGQEQILSLLASKTVSVGLDAQGRAEPDISVSWSYRGSYGGVELDSISAVSAMPIG